MEFIIGDMAKIAKGDTFGGRLTQAREEAERWGEVDTYTYTQQELVDLLAERFGVAIGRSYLSELERNWQQNKMTSLEVAVALARALRVNLNWLAGLSHPPHYIDDISRPPRRAFCCLLPPKLMSPNHKLPLDIYVIMIYTVFSDTECHSPNRKPHATAMAGVRSTVKEQGATP
jgi:hypothetical protein